MSAEKGTGKTGVNIVVPLADREPAAIQAALGGKSEFVLEQALKLHAYAREKHLGVSALADQTRIGGGILSPFFNGGYVGDDEAIAERIASFFRRLKAKEEFGDIREFVDTNMAQYLRSVFQKTATTRRIQVIQGPEQCGKTRAAKQYATDNNHGRTVYCEISGGTTNGVNEFIRKLAQSLELPYTIKLHEAKLRIREKLEAADLVIVDEAHLVWRWGNGAIANFLDFLRTDIFANGSRGVILLSTNDSWFQRLQQFKKTGHNIGQLLGRMRNEAVEIDPADDILVEDVTLLAERYYKEGKPGKRAMGALHQVAIQPQLGHFGLIVDIMNESWLEARKKKRVLDDDVVVAVCERIMGKMKARKDLYS